MDNDGNPSDDLHDGWTGQRKGKGKKNADQLEGITAR